MGKRPTTLCYKNRMEGKTGEYVLIIEMLRAQLNRTGFEWTSIKGAGEAWHHRLLLMCVVKRMLGYCLVPQRLVADTIKLGQRVNSQRMNGETGQSEPLIEERSAQFNMIGFELRIRRSTYPATLAYSAISGFFVLEVNR